MGGGVCVAVRLACGNALFSSARLYRPWRNASRTGSARGDGGVGSARLSSCAAAPRARGLGRASRGRGGVGRHGRAREKAPVSGTSGYSRRAGVIS